MNTLPDSTFLLIGLADTGKTHFLVALDVVLDDPVGTDALVHSTHANDRTYLVPLRELWLAGEKLGHTSRQQPPPPHQLLVNHPASGTSVGFHLPDLAGETFDAHFETRSFPEEFCVRLRQAAGLFIFIHSGQNADHDLIENPAFRETADPSEATNTSPKGEVSSEWRLLDAAPQVKLVDLLQFISEAGLKTRPLPLAVMISAWDLVENLPSGATGIPKVPERFLATQWPLLDQFLKTHRDTFTFRAFGVSARGGDDNPQENDRIAKIERARDRVILVDGAHRSSDITRPVRWLLGLLESEEPTDD